MAAGAATADAVILAVHTRSGQRSQVRMRNQLAALPAAQV